MIKPFAPNLLVAIADSGDSPRKINVGIVSMVPPPTKVPNEAEITPTRKTTDRVINIKNF